MALSRPNNGALSASDHVFLCMLTGGSRSAWDVKREMERTVRHFWMTPQSQIYQQARKLTALGLVAEHPVPDHPRRRKLLALTAEGRAIVTAWLRLPAAEPQYHVEGLVKLYFAAAAGDPAATRAMVEDERRAVRERLAHMENALARMRDRPDLFYESLVLEAGIANMRTTIRSQTHAIRRITEQQSLAP